MDLTCRCKADYMCVACKVKRGDYRTWKCTDPYCYKPRERNGLCLAHYNAERRSA